MEETTARLRKTFHYPTDDDDDSLPEALDEEEQESLIRTLTLENTTRNTQFARLLLCIPLLSCIPYVPTLLTGHTTFLSLLSITSLLSTAYLVYALPAGRTGIAILDEGSGIARSKSPTTTSRNPLAFGPGPGSDQGPVLTYLPYLNIALGVVLALLGLVGGAREVAWVGFAWLPGGVYAVAIVAKVVMGSVNPEAELSALRYEYKGA